MRKIRYICVYLLFVLTARAQQPKLMLPIGHTDQVNTAEYSPDEKKIVTASDDKTIKIWDVETGVILANLKGHKDNVISAVFSPDGSKILSYSDDETAKIWDALTGMELKDFSVGNKQVIVARFAPSGNQILTVSEDSTVKIWNSNTYELINTIKSPDGGFSDAYFNKEGTAIIACGLTGKSNGIWDISVPGGRKYPVTHLFNGPCIYAAFSPDGTQAYMVNDSIVSIWNLKSNKESVINTKKFKIGFAALSPDYTRLVLKTAIKSTTNIYGDDILWVYNIFKPANNPAKPDSLVFYKTLNGKDGTINSVRFSSDCNKIVTAHNSKIVIWDLVSTAPQISTDIPYDYTINSAVLNNAGTHILASLAEKYATLIDISNPGAEKTFDGHTSTIFTQNFSIDGTRIFTGGEDGIGRLWDNKTGKLLLAMNEHEDAITCSDFSKNGKWLASGSLDSSALIWDAVTGKLLFILNDHLAQVNSVKFSLDNTHVVTASDDSTAILWKINDKGECDLVKSVHGNGVVSLAFFSPDSKKFITISNNKYEVKIWDAITGALKATISDNPKDSNRIGTEILSVSFSPDSKKILTTSQWKNGNGMRGPQIWDANDGHFIANPVIHDEDGQGYAIFSPDGKKILYVYSDLMGISRFADMGEIHGASLIDANTYKLIAQLDHLGELAQGYYDARFSPDGQKLVFSFADNVAMVWNANTGKYLFDLRGHTSDVNTTLFSPDSKYILTSSADNTLKKWNANNGDLLYTFFPIDFNDYLVLDKYDRYDGTPAARKLLYFTCGTEVIQLEQFKGLSWEPGLVNKIMGLNQEPITAKKIADINICNFTPIVSSTKTNDGGYQFTIKARNGGIGELQLFVNDKMIKKYSPAALTKLQDSYQLKVNENEIKPFFVSGVANKVLVQATTSEGSMTARGPVLLRAATGTKVSNPNMYIVSIGINQYKGETIRLKYASTDAESFASALTASARKLLNTDGKEHVNTIIFSTEPNNRNWPSKEAISQKMNELSQSVSPDDILVFFFAGHGVLQSGQKNFYLLTSDAEGFDMSGVEKQVSISTDELNQWMRNIKANKQLLILDACNSGQVLTDMQAFAKRDVPADQIRALEDMKDKSGTFILSASASGQSAYETSQFGQGLLTYSLLSSIKNQNGLKENKFIDVTGWFNTSSNNVKVLAREIGGIQDPQIIGNASFDVGLVDQEVMNGIKLSSRKKIMNRTIVYTGDPLLLLDDQQLASEINRELNDRSAGSLQNPFTYIENNTSPEALSLRGSYTVTGQTITVKLSLISGKTKVKDITQSGTINGKGALAKKIVDDVILYLKSVSN